MGGSVSVSPHFLGHEGVQDDDIHSILDRALRGCSIDKLRRQFPNDSYTVHQRVKSMVVESKRIAEIARMEDEITRLAAVGPTWGNL